MSEGHPTAAQKEALRLVCDHEPMPADRRRRQPVAS